MAFATTYRPLKFSEVLGQEGTITILKSLLQSGKIFHKSYVFAGSSGTGKTTLARILARAMLCENVVDGEPCNTCTTCLEIIEGTPSFQFTEMDGANNSGVATVRSIVEGSEYFNLSGSDRKIYLIDECHALSRDAMDALLKPLEESAKGSEDKRLVCLFCTTEPAKLRDTIKSRCLTFGITTPPEEAIHQRLTEIADAEGIEVEPQALSLIYARSRGHVRDMITSLEGVAIRGPVTVATTRDFFGLADTDIFNTLIKSLGSDLPTAMEVAIKLSATRSAGEILNMIGSLSMSAYKVGLKVTEGVPPSDWEGALEVYDVHKDRLLDIARYVFELNSRGVVEEFLVCEVGYLHHLLSGKVDYPSSSSLPLPVTTQGVPAGTSVTAPAGDQPTVTPPKPLSNLELSSDPLCRDHYGSQGHKFVKASFKEETASREASVKPRQKSLRPCGPQDFGYIRSLFDD